MTRVLNNHNLGPATKTAPGILSAETLVLRARGGQLRISGETTVYAIMQLLEFNRPHTIRKRKWTESSHELDPKIWNEYTMVAPAASLRSAGLQRWTNTKSKQFQHGTAPL